MSVILVDVGEAPKAAAVMLRRLTNITITDLTALVDALPLTLYESLPRPEAERVRRLLQGVGADVELRVPRRPTAGITKPFSPTDLAA